MTKTHWLRLDHRIESLRITLIGLDNSIQYCYKKYHQVEWYDGGWLLEETDPIYGLSFIALQSYINSSIYDRFESLDNKEKFYKLGRKLNDKRTDIELIIGISNYFKHRDDNKPFNKGTKSILDDFCLDLNDNVNSKSPIIYGINELTKTGGLLELMNHATSWREKLWNINH